MVTKDVYTPIPAPENRLLSMAKSHFVGVIKLRILR